MRPITHLIAAAAVAIVLGLTACSPEDGREPGERGADIGNRPERPADVELHGKQNPNFDVPNRLPEAEQSGRR